MRTHIPGNRKMRRLRQRGVGLLVGTLLASTLVSQPAGAFWVSIHEQITFAALGDDPANFLDRAVYLDVSDEHEQVDGTFAKGDFTDSGGRDERHFDDCEFDGSVEWINDRYDDALAALAVGDVWDATDAFGRALHTIQDLYTHSNWVEMGFPQTGDASLSDLLELGGAPSSSFGDWQAPAGGGVVRHDVEIGNVTRDVLLGNDDWNIPAGWEIREEGLADDVPTLFDPSGTPIGVLLMTGEGNWGTAGTDDDECDVYYEGTTVRAFNGYEHDETLNKDGPGRPGYEQARALALLQTGYEWCRLLHKAAGIGADGLLQALWVRRGGVPHPPGTPCGPEASGRTEVTFTVDRVGVLDTGDDDDPGRVRLAVTLYDDAFSRSAHGGNPILNPADVSDGDTVRDRDLPLPLTLCVGAADGVSVALHGWENDGDEIGHGVGSGEFDDFGDDDDDVLIGFQRRFGPELPEGTFTADSGHLTVDYRVTGGTDSDGDRLGDCDERIDGTDPDDADSDDDRLDDGDETDLGTDPNSRDTDGDEVEDGDEVDAGTDPTDADSDDDDLNDGEEIDLGTDPLHPDTDDDRLDDGDEVELGTDPLDPDTDDDELEDGLEVDVGTDPKESDTDDDLIIDGHDVEWVQAAVEGLPHSAFRDLGDGHRTALLARLDDAERAVARGNFAAATRQLENLRGRIDGCGFVADVDDWIVDCGAQIVIRSLVDELAANLTT